MVRLLAESGWKLVVNSTVCQANAGAATAQPWASKSSSTRLGSGCALWFLPCAVGKTARRLAFPLSPLLVKGGPGGWGTYASDLTSAFRVGPHRSPGAAAETGWGYHDHPVARNSPSGSPALLVRGAAGQLPQNPISTMKPVLSRSKSCNAETVSRFMRESQNCRSLRCSLSKRAKRTIFALGKTLSLLVWTSHHSLAHRDGLDSMFF